MDDPFLQLMLPSNSTVCCSNWQGVDEVLSGGAQHAGEEPMEIKVEPDARQPPAPAPHLLPPVCGADPGVVTLEQVKVEKEALGERLFAMR